MKKYTIEKGYLLFDQIYISKEVAYQIEEENGTHKDTVKEGYYIYTLDELALTSVPCEYYKFATTYKQALQVASQEELEIL